MLSGPTPFYVMKEFGYVRIARIVVVSFYITERISSYKFQEVRSNKKMIPIKARCHFQSYLVGHLENKG